MNLALKDINHNLGRFLLTCVGISLLLCIVLAMVGIYRGLIVEALGLVRAAQAQVWVVEGGTRGPFAEASRLSGDTREAIAAQWGVAAAGSVAYQNVEALHRGQMKRLLVVGAEISRLGQAPALANDPRIILADEPTAALDSQRAGIVIDMLRKVAAEHQAAVIVVTHDHKIYDRFDHIFSMRDGALEAEIRKAA